MDMAQLIVERTTIFSYIIPTQESEENRLHTLNCLFVMFNNFLIKLPEFKSPFTCPDYPDLVMVSFDYPKFELQILIAACLSFRFTSRMATNIQFI